MQTSVDHKGSSGVVEASGVHLWRALSGAEAAVQRILASALRPLGLTPQQYALLEELEAMRCGCCGEGECRCPSSYLCQNDITARVATTKGNVSGIVHRLVQDGLISREPDPRDRRCNSIRITAKGRTALLAARPVADRAAHGAFAALPPREAETLCALLRRIAGLRPR